METQGRCKSCRNYLTVPPDQPCQVCYTVNNPNQKANRHTGRMLMDTYAFRPSNNNYYAAAYGQPAYPSYYSPQVYGSGYNSPQQHATVYSNGYCSPLLHLAAAQALPPPIVYGLGYYNQYNQQVHERKRAVLCGVTYKGHPKTLHASTTNVRSMHQLLRKLGFRDASIRVLTEEESADPTKTPTRYNILKELKWLTKGSQSGDSLVFYYAGHGSRVPDFNGDEADWFDEAICPVDYRVSGKIIDDELHDILVAPLPHGVTLHSIMDTCFSGTLLDLPFLCRVDWGGFYMWENQHPSHASQYGGTCGGKAICISACDDTQNSSDTTAFTGNAIGALTHSFTEAVQSAGYKLTYGGLLDNMRQTIRKAREDHGLYAPFASPNSQVNSTSTTKLITLICITNYNNVGASKRRS